MLEGRLPHGVSAKDVMLLLLSLPYFKSGRSIGQVLEFCGSGLLDLPLDERATLTNMAVEAGGFTGIIEADEVVLAYLSQMRGCTREELADRVVRADANATYAAEIRLDLGSVVPMVATPGDPRNGIPLDRLESDSIAIDIAYGGSCTGGKKADMDMYAGVLKTALEHGRRVHPRVTLYIQFGSQHIRDYAEQRGYLDVFERAGATLVDPSCGACIRAGPGVSTRADQVTVSAMNRNFPGRSGPGKVYLASPLVVAASAIAGKLSDPRSALEPIVSPPRE
jgi:3-isopropylmalate/(R)-2-methylmalate dehydratase large subunit